MATGIKQRLAERKKALVAPLPALAAVAVYVLTGVDVNPEVILTVVGVISAIVVERKRNAGPSA